MSSISFQERQFFRQWYVWIPLVVTDLIIVWGIIQQVFLGKPFGNNPASDVWLILTFVLVLLVTLLLLSMHLYTEINSLGVRIYFFPLFRKQYLWGDIEDAYVREYKPLREFGGWGIRFGKDGPAYNVSGRMGMELCLKNGKKVLIGTQQPDELRILLHNRFQGRKGRSE